MGHSRYSRAQCRRGETFMSNQNDIKDAVMVAAALFTIIKITIEIIELICRWLI